MKRDKNKLDHCLLELMNITIMVKRNYQLTFLGTPAAVCKTKRTHLNDLIRQKTRGLKPSKTEIHTYKPPILYKTVSEHDMR